MIFSLFALDSFDLNSWWSPCYTIENKCFRHEFRKHDEQQNAHACIWRGIKGASKENKLRVCATRCILPPLFLPRLFAYVCSVPSIYMLMYTCRKIGAVSIHPHIWAVKHIAYYFQRECLCSMLKFSHWIFLSSLFIIINSIMKKLTCF